MSRATGHYFDARTLHAEPVEIFFGESHLHILRAAGEVAVLVPIHDVRVSDRLGHVPRFLYLPDDASIETPDNDAVDAVLTRRRRGRVNACVHWLEQRARVAAVATVLLAACVVAAVAFGLPVAARKIAHRVPAEIERQAGRAALGTLTRFLQPSQLSATDRQRVIELTERLVATQGLAGKPALEFRSMGKHANAFALPGGIIVVSDALVQLASDDELSAVLAHEIGHWQQRHGLQGVLRGSAALLVVTAVTGDLSTLTTFAGTIPFTLLQRGYSRAFEVEADEFALAALQRAKIDARHLASILDKLEKTREGGRGDYSYLSTHPSTSDRVRRIDPTGTFAEFARASATYDLAALTIPPTFSRQPLPEIQPSVRALGKGGDVEVTFVVDELGRTRDIQIDPAAHPSFALATATAVKGWTFSPGRKGSRAVSTRVKATVQLRLDREPMIVCNVGFPPEPIVDITKGGVPPKMTHSVPPEFPVKLRLAGLSGEVMVEYIVDRQGNVTDAQVVRSTHAEFEAPAIAAVMQWKFTPGSRDGRTVKTRVQQVITFNLNEEPDDDEPAAASAETPVRTLADWAAGHKFPTLLVQTAPVHPPGRRSVEADVTVEFSVNRDGHVVDAHVVTSTNSDFDAAALDAVAKWRFTPQAATVDARVLSTLRYEIHFRRDPTHPVATVKPASAY